MQDYTAAEAARILNCNYRTVLNSITRGFLKSYKIGGRYYVTKEAIDEYQGQPSIHLTKANRENEDIFFLRLPERYSLNVEDFKDVNTKHELYGLDDLTEDKYYRVLSDIYRLAFKRGMQYSEENREMTNNYYQDKKVF